MQGLLIAAAERVLGAPVKITGASRTDAGVHALRQVASLATSSPMPPAALRRALNALLPAAVRVTAAREAPAGFDARRWARGKRYVYLIDRAPQADPFRRRHAWHVPFALDAAAMAAGLRAVRGKHDFRAFCAAAGRDRTPTCTVRSARVVIRRHLLAVCLSADSFLHHMVRNIVGSLVEIGRGAHPPGLDRRAPGRTRPDPRRPHRSAGGPLPRPGPVRGDRDAAGRADRVTELTETGFVRRYVIGPLPLY